MWLVSDECTWVGWKTKRLWNSCQVRTAQNGLLTAFYISLHHSSWTLPLISSPALTWEFNFFFSCWGGGFFSFLPPPPFSPVPPSLPPDAAVAVAVAVALALLPWPSQHPRAMERGHAGRVVEPLQRGLSSPAGLARIQAASQENAQKILAVQVGDCREVGKIILI